MRRHQQRRPTNQQTLKSDLPRRQSAKKGSTAPEPDPAMSIKIGTLQQLDDAMAFRAIRLHMPCLHCTASKKCAEHAYDEYLFETYQERYAATWEDAFTGMHPDDIEELTEIAATPRSVGLLAAPPGATRAGTTEHPCQSP